MALNAYRKGRRLEDRTIRALQRMGYECVRSAGSHGPFDVCAFGLADVRLVQSRANRWATATEVDAMRLFPAPPRVRKEIWRWDDYARAPRIREVE